MGLKKAQLARIAKNSDFYKSLYHAIAHLEMGQAAHTVANQSAAFQPAEFLAWCIMNAPGIGVFRSEWVEYESDNLKTMRERTADFANTSAHISALRGFDSDFYSDSGITFYVKSPTYGTAFVTAAFNYRARVFANLTFREFMLNWSVGVDAQLKRFAGRVDVMLAFVEERR